MSTEPQRKQVEVSADIAAPPETVWRLVSDLNRMGEWSPECTRIDWVRSAPVAGAPPVGAVFKGRNKIGVRRWTTKGTIVAADPNRRIAWDIAALGLPGARWGYSIEPTDSGCRVTESWEDKRGGLLRILGSVATGVKDRAAHNEAGMRTTLERLKAAAEAQGR